MNVTTALPWVSQKAFQQSRLPASVPLAQPRLTRFQRNRGSELLLVSRHQWLDGARLAAYSCGRMVTGL
jgi:hypothetical protein